MKKPTHGPVKIASRGDFGPDVQRLVTQPPPRQQISDDILNGVYVLLDVAVEHHHDRPSGETMVECHVCGEWEGHTTECFVPALDRWLATPGEFVSPSTPVPTRIECSWCDAVMQLGTRPISHSMCPRCQSLTDEEVDLQVDYVRAMRRKE